MTCVGEVTVQETMVGGVDVPSANSKPCSPPAKFGEASATSVVSMTSGGKGTKKVATMVTPVRVIVTGRTGSHFPIRSHA